MSVMLALPSRGSILVPTLLSVQVVQREHPDVEIKYHGNHLSSFEARNDIVRMFLATKHSVLMMVDDDMIFNGDVMKLADMGEWDILAGAYPVFQSQVSAAPVVATYKLHPDGYIPYEDCWSLEGRQACDGVGFGAVAIKRSLLTKMNDPWFYEKQIKGGKPMTDDLQFCRDAQRKFKAKIGCDYDVQCEHYKTVPLFDVMAGTLAMLQDGIEGTNGLRQAQVMAKRRRRWSS